MRIANWVFQGLLIGSLAAGGALTQEDKGVKEDVKEAGKATGRAAKKTGRKIKKGTKKAVNKTAEKTEEGAGKVKRKTQ